MSFQLCGGQHPEPHGCSGGQHLVSKSYLKRIGHPDPRVHFLCFIDTETQGVSENLPKGTQVLKLAKPPHLTSAYSNDQQTSIKYVKLFRVKIGVENGLRKIL